MTKINKKGISMIWTVILSVIVIIITFAAVSYAAGRFTSELPNALESTACSTSVGLRAFSLEKTGTMGSAAKDYIIPSLRCKTNEFTITSKDEDKIKSELADALYLCWRDLGKGQTDFIGKEVLRTKACVICSIIDFKNKGMEISGFQDYLANMIVPTTNITYLDYITNSKGIGKEGILGGEQKIDTSKKYTITYSVYSDEYLIPVAADTTGCAASAVVLGYAGGVIGSVVPGVGNIAGIAVGGVIGCGAGAIGADIVVQKIKVWFGKGKPTYAMYLQEFNADELNKACTKVESI